MSNTVSSSVKHLPTSFLPGIPAQPTGEQSVQATAQTRLVPAVVGVKGRTQRIHVECPIWCVVDHSRIVTLDEVTHYSSSDVVQVPTFLHEDTSHSDLSLSISVDPDSPDPREREAHILVDNGTFEEARLTPQLAEELADDLIAFASQLRHRAREAARFNAGGAQ
ncbi:DUF6907 domain-containing protein [Streptomyces sp. NPDC056543]|uniref:DUF6907 domain-containing protein n=1 Tax=unclassified Streptomyces TaxID=2593676 RepID=UPI0036B6FD75